MMKKLAQWAAMLAMLAAAGAAAATELSDDSLGKLLDLSGINKQVAAYPGLVKAGVEMAQARAAQQKQNALSDADYTALKNAMAEAFQPGPILQATGAAVKKKVSEADATQLIAWFQSDLGKKITQAEVDASTPEARQDMMAKAQTLLADKERMAFARKLDALLHATDEGIKLQERTATAMYTAVNKQMHPDQPLDIKGFNQKIEAVLKQARPNIEMSTLVTFAYTYRNMDMGSLNKYAAFLARPATRRFNDSSRAGMLEGVDQAVTKVADNVAEMAKKKEHEKKKAG